MVPLRFTTGYLLLALRASLCGDRPGRVIAGDWAYLNSYEKSFASPQPYPALPSPSAVISPGDDHTCPLPFPILPFPFYS